MTEWLTGLFSKLNACTFLFLPRILVEIFLTFYNFLILQHLLKCGEGFDGDCLGTVVTDAMCDWALKHVIHFVMRMMMAGCWFYSSNADLIWLLWSSPIGRHISPWAPHGPAPAIRPRQPIIIFISSTRQKTPEWSACGKYKIEAGGQEANLVNLSTDLPATALGHLLASRLLRLAARPAAEMRWWWDAPPPATILTV